jgi:FAD/FMN-containing dehydrogenase
LPLPRQLPTILETGSWYGVAGGATLWDVYRRFHTAYGVTLPGGSCYSVGAGGHVTGGGYGLLSRRYGLTIDVLHAVEVLHVTALGRAEVITVSRDASDSAEQDLFWGHLGGGVHFVDPRFVFPLTPRSPARRRPREPRQDRVLPLLLRR